LTLVLSNVTVEPVTFVLELAHKMDEVAVKDTLMYKMCIHNFGETDAVCNALLNDNNHDLNKAVQNEVSLTLVIV
jgi:hypothetical protein